ncbi:MAG: penicillin acylase family protein [Saprospiraceae bacterium]
MAPFIKFFSAVVLTSALVFWLNGTIKIPGSTQPPLGKLLNPYSGVWTSHTESEHLDATYAIHGLKAPCTIIYDERRVPHIEAGNLEDALFAQGFVEAQNRLFQMFFLTKVASGSLSEFFGDRTIAMDLEKRRWGLKYAAENAAKAWETMPHFGLIQKYVDGINAYIDQLDPKDYPIEFKLLGIKPERWTVLHSALIFKQMSMTLAGMNQDIQNTNLHNILGDADFKALFNPSNLPQDPVIPTGTTYKFDTLFGLKPPLRMDFDSLIYDQAPEEFKRGTGSNSWAVSGKKTKSGHPIFCNDPHLSLTLPSIWIECQMKTPEFNTYGVSFPGFPGIMIGFNEYIAWGETNVSQEISDLYTIKWADSERKGYYLDGKIVAPTTRIETIKIKGKPDLIDTVYYTQWGPIIRKSTDSKTDLALRWLVHDIPDKEEFYTFIAGMQCQDYNAYLDATDPFITPAQNFGFASSSGDIAMRVNGRFPAIYDDEGRFVKQGDRSENGWEAFIPKSQVPQVKNPPRNFVASANQKSTDNTYPYYYTGIFENSRNQRINTLLNKAENITPQDMMSMQMDDHSVLAQAFLQIMETTLTDSLRQMSEVADLLKWDGSYNAKSEMPTLFELFVDQVQALTWDEITDKSTNIDTYLPDPWRLVMLMKKEPESRWFDVKKTPQIETGNDIINDALINAMTEKMERKQKGLSNEWGDFHTTNIHHLMRIPTFSALDLKANGCPDAINANAGSFGPSWRMVVSLDSVVTAYGVYPGGQSGNPTSKYYKNMVADWVVGKYYALHFEKDFAKLLSLKTSQINLKPLK